MTTISDKKITLLFLVIFAIVLAGTAFAQSEDEALKLYQEGQEAQKNGKYQEALGYFGRSLRIFCALNLNFGIEMFGFKL
ncbi:MAG: hypothetical protein HZA10_04350 [Nitrospirae bacterium]|nr:hypothetical protein [Nitrospirota bacterium]